MANQKKTGGSNKRNHEVAPVKYKKKRSGSGGRKRLTSKEANIGDGKTRLNKYLAQAGVCSRREADLLIELGSVTVNGEIIVEMGYKVNPGDVVKYEGQTLSHEEPVYILINKPKEFHAITDDPTKTKSVGSLIKNFCKQQVYPVGKMERTSTGVLLLTNDHDMILKLTHPKHDVKKIFQIELDKPFRREDFDKLTAGYRNEHGIFIKVKEIAYLGTGKNQIGVEIDSQVNRITEKIFEGLGYNIKKQDRVYFAGLTKKNLSRSEFRYLTEEEVKALKMLG
jgi:23S rRNA pseudouridine2605 synthase